MKYKSEKYLSPNINMDSLSLIFPPKNIGVANPNLNG